MFMYRLQYFHEFCINVRALLTFFASAITIEAQRIFCFLTMGEKENEKCVYKIDFKLKMYWNIVYWAREWENEMRSGFYSDELNCIVADVDVISECLNLGPNERTWMHGFRNSCMRFFSNGCLHFCSGIFFTLSLSLTLGFCFSNGERSKLNIHQNSCAR